MQIDNDVIRAAIEYTLVIDPTVEHFARLFKAPQNFSLRGLVGHAGQESYLRKLNAGVRLFSNEADGCNAVALTRVLARWNARLSNYSKETTNLTKHAKAVRASILKATDPIALLCESLPKAVEGSIAPEKMAATISSIDQAIDEISVADRELRKDVAEKLGAAFGLRGSLASVRAALCQECKAPTHQAVDYQLKSFVTRCVDPALTDDKWLESVAGLVTHRSMDNWTDATVELFALEIKRFAAQLRRWIDLMLERGQIISGAENLVRVAVTDGAGHEFREVFHRDILSSEERQRAINAIVKVTGVTADD